MKNKKVIAIALCIGIISTSFSGIFTSYAKNSEVVELVDTSKALSPDITELNVVVNNEVISSSNNGSERQAGNSIVIYQSTKTTLGPNSEGNDVYDLDEKEIEQLINKGYSLEDIFEADEIGNEIYEDPMTLLKKKKDTRRTLEDIKDEILKDRKEKSTEYLKKKFDKDISKLQKDKMKDDEIISFLAYLDMTGQQLTDDLIKEYRKKGKDLFKEMKLHNNNDEKVK